VPGLELVGEDIAELADDEGQEFEGFYYLVLPDAAATNQLLALWTKYEANQALGQAHARWKDVFECLHALRRWGPQDRLRPEDGEFIRDMAKHEPNSEILLEIELLFRSGAPADVARAAAVQSIQAIGGRVLQQVRHESFAFDALLVGLPAAEALKAANYAPGSLAALDSAFSIHVQSLSDATSVGLEDEVAVGASSDDQPDANRPPILAVIDAAPQQNHVRLGPRLIVEDPLGLEPLSIGARRHGTAMASLVIHGDLDRNEAPLARRIVLAPMMYAPKAAGAGDEREIFRTERILVDDFVTAILRLKRGVPGSAATAPDALIFSISLGDLHRPFHGRVSPWARAMDWLSAELGILFVVSAGNAAHAFEVTALPNAAAFAALQGVDRTKAVLAALRDDMRFRTLLAPGESINALTVGALHDDDRSGASSVGASLDPLPDGRFPSIVSRLGPGFGRSVKPDILVRGGRLRVVAADAGTCAELRPSLANRFGGVRVCAAGVDKGGQPALEGWSGASSAAAALAARGAHRVHDALEAAYGATFMTLPDEKKALILKALIAHRARWPQPELQHLIEVFGPANPRQVTAQKMNAMRVFGFGVADIDEVLGCIESRATLWGEGAVIENDAAVFKVPLPVSLSGQRVPHAVTATLAWFSPVIPGRRAYKSVRLTIEEPPTQRLGSLGVKPASDMGDRNQTERGTLFQRRWQGQAVAQISNGDALEFRVARKPDREEDEDRAPIAFGVAISIEAEAGLPIYDEVSLQVSVKPTVPVQV
jgi:hypothetical protein